MYDTANIICHIFQYKLTKISDIYVSTTGYLLQKVNIFCCRINSQHSMLAHNDLNNISIEPYKHEILTTFMLEYGVNINRSFNLITDIQC